MILGRNGTPEKLFICLSFDFVRFVRNVNNFNYKPKKVVIFWASVLWFSLFIEHISTLLTMHCLKFLFHIDNQIDLVVLVTFVKKNSWRNCKKKILYFLVPSWRCQHFRHILQHPKLNLMTSFSSSPMTA